MDLFLFACPDRFASINGIRGLHSAAYWLTTQHTENVGQPTITPILT